MKKQELYPKIIFNSSNSAWMRYPLHECGKFNPVSILPEEFEYVDLESVIGTEMCAHRTENQETAPSRAQRLAQKHDIFYQTVRPYQKNNYLFDKEDENYVFSTGYAQIRPYIDERFLFSLMQKGSFVDEVLMNCTGTSYPAISASALSDIRVYVPTDRKVQKKIGQYFKQIDHLISNTAKEIQKLRQLKAASLQAMFPQDGETTPRLRFKGFDGEWKPIQIGKVASFSKGSGYSKSDIRADGNPIILYGRMYTDYSVTISNVDTFALPKTGNILSKKGDIIVPASGETPEDIAVASVVNEEGVILGGDINIIRVDNQVINPIFLALSLTFTKTQRKLSALAQGKSVVHLNNANIANTCVELPCLKEQTKIADFFLNLDTQIKLTEKKLEKLRQIKASCLDLMFV